MIRPDHVHTAAWFLRRNNHGVDELVKEAADVLLAANPNKYLMDMIYESNGRCKRDISTVGPTRDCTEGSSLSGVRVKEELEK